jgi:hypothetical protein
VGLESLDWRRLVLMTPSGTVPDSHLLFLAVRVLGCFELLRKDSSIVRGDFPIAELTMVVICVEGEDPLSPDSKGFVTP